MRARLGLTVVLAGVAVVVGLMGLMLAQRTPHGALGGRDPVLVSASGAGWHGAANGAVQTGGDVADENAERVPVQVWTVFAAGGALSAGLLLFLLRVVMGGVKPPPSQEEGHH